MIGRISEEYEVSVKDIEDIEDALWGFIRNTVTSCDFKNMDMETFKGTKKNFNIPKLGKFYANEPSFKRINKL